MNLDKLKQNKTTEKLLEFGIINIDKPSGPTSFTVSDFIRKTLGLRKTSHFGTLDPKVTGVLPIALNRACKLTGDFLGHDKTYVGIMRFHDEISIEKIKETINKKFLGKITQKPPVKSRVKRIERQREIHEFKILEKEQKDFLFETKVEGGTYIRKLVDDLGKEINIGAHMLELRRTKAGIFSENNEQYPSVNLYDFEKSVDEYKKGNDKLLRQIITPAEIISEVYSTIEIKESEIKKLFTGKPIHWEDLVDKEKTLKDIKEYYINNKEISREKRVGRAKRVWAGKEITREIPNEKDQKVVAFSKDKLIGIYRITDEKEIFARPEFVLQPIK